MSLQLPLNRSAPDKVDLQFEQEVRHQSLASLRFIPPANLLGSHEDPDPETRNTANSCYCLEDQGFPCFKSGVLNLAPCKRSPDLPLGAPIALSYPHFYQADQSFRFLAILKPVYLFFVPLPHVHLFRDAVGGLSPRKEEHQFYVDISPEFGFPLAIRPRFQLNAIIQRDPDIPIMR